MRRLPWSMTAIFRQQPKPPIMEACMNAIAAAPTKAIAPMPASTPMATFSVVFMLQPSFPVPSLAICFQVRPPSALTKTLRLNVAMAISCGRTAFWAM